MGLLYVWEHGWEKNEQCQEAWCVCAGWKEQSESEAGLLFIQKDYDWVTTEQWEEARYACVGW